MRYHNITKDDMLNGDGLRVVLWVAGCNHCCPECQNPVTWDPNGGLPFGEAERKEIFAELDKDYVSGITFSVSFSSLASVYRMAAAPSPSMEPKFPCPSTSVLPFLKS